MDNLIGDEIDRWPELAADPARALHLYGKGAARPGPQDGPRHPPRLTPNEKARSIAAPGLPAYRGKTAYFASITCTG